ncbi:MAG: hypothetical protein R3C49_22010 [Planctomycetaceae bacterium]
MLELPDKDGNIQKIKIELDGYDTSTYDLTIPKEWLQSRKQSQSHGIEFPEVWTFQVGKIENDLFGQLQSHEICRSDLQLHTACPFIGSGSSQ